MTFYLQVLLSFTYMKLVAAAPIFLRKNINHPDYNFSVLKSTVMQII